MAKNPPASAGDVDSVPGSGRSHGKEMATHSGIFAWEIPWTEEPGGLQHTGSQRVRHDWVTKKQKQHNEVEAQSIYTTCLRFQR